MKKYVVLLMTVMLFFAFSQTNALAANYDKATTTKKVKVYAGAGTSERVRFTIPKGKSVKVMGAEQEGWDQYELSNAEKYGFYFVSYKGKTGWIAQGFLKFKNPYNWVPGIKLEAIKYADYYADGNPYKFVKGSNWHSEGYYDVMVKMSGKWYKVGYVNCKTGWAHG